MAKTADDLLTMFRLGKESQRNFGMQISKKLPPGQGGSPGQAPPKPHPGPFVPAPKKDSLKIAKGFVRKVGEPIGVRDFVHGAEIIDATETNPLKKYLRLKRMEKNNPLDPSLGGV